MCIVELRIAHVCRWTHSWVCAGDVRCVSRGVGVVVARVPAGTIPCEQHYAKSMCCLIAAKQLAARALF